MNAPFASRHLLVSVSLLVTACGSDDAMTDSAVDPMDSAMAIDSGTPTITVDIPPIVPAPPSPPSPPTLSPCPEGLIEEALASGLVVCAPWMGEPPTCAAPAAPFVGEPTCVVVGDRCPGDGWPTSLPSASETLYVAPSGSSTGAGTRSDPLDTIGAALARSSAGTVVAVAVGTYAENVVVPSGVSVIGACASGTVIENAASAPAIVVSSADVTLRALRIRGGRAGIEVRNPVASATLEDMVVDGTNRVALHVADGAVVTGQNVVLLDADDIGMRVEEASADLDRLAIVGARVAGVRVSGAGSSTTLTRASIVGVRSRDGTTAAVGARVETSGTLTMNASAIVGVFGTGAEADAANLTFRDVVIRDLRGASPGRPGGEGLVALASGRVDAERLFIDGARRSGVRAGDTATLMLSDVVITGTVGEEPSDVGGRGLTLRNDATAVLERALLSDNREAAISAVGAIDVTMRDTVVSDTAPDALIGLRGAGVSATGGAAITMERVSLSRNHEHGVLLTGDGTQLDGSDVAISDTRSDAAGEGGRGIDAQDGATVELARASIARSPQLGVLVVRGARVTLSDATVGAALGDGAGNFGRGLETQNADLTLNTTIVEDVRDVALLSTGPSRIALTDVAFERIVSREADGAFGRVVELQDGADATLTRVLVEDYADLGVFAAGTATRLVAADLLVRGGTGRAFDGRFGRGVTLQAGATATLDGAVVESTREVAVAVYGEGTTLTMMNAAVRDALIQRCVPDPCPALALGVGLGVYAGGHADLVRFEIERSALVGIQLAPGLTAGGEPAAVGGTADASDGRVSGSPVGANVQTEGFDVARISRTVDYSDNETNLDSTVLPVPAPVDPL